MDKLQEKFKDIDLESLIKKKEFVLNELKISINQTSKLHEILDKINKQFLELSNSTYSYDSE